MFAGIGKLLLGTLIAVRGLQTPEELHQAYYNVFPSGNRNAASHRWATYVIERSQQMTDATFRNLMGSFCAVSGSPVSASPQARWKMTLPLVTGGDITGMMYYCCAPCLCDTQEFIEVDTKTITTTDGPKQYHFTVIGNPCLHPEELTKQWADPFTAGLTTIQKTAPDVKCIGNSLEKATVSDKGHIILGMFFETGTPGHATPDLGFSDASEMSGFCAARADQGHASGMGEIFRKVALISPLRKGDNSWLPSWLV